ncbi:hypothetical protein VF21_01833 [Pseudogymnoascus sp. 05NY08]|nr:hypothetical protein VF21_01833 [Pseudogymnoascus sp. 05NY08]
MADIMNAKIEGSSDGFSCTPEDFTPNIIGLYGISGAGKSHYLSMLQVHSQLEVCTPFQFFEGSSVINSFFPGGLPAFKELPEEQKVKLREKAICSIKDECTIGRTNGIVAGHATFWDEKDDSEIIVITPKDLEIYSHILYLKTDPEVIQQHCLSDWERIRDIVPLEHLEKWQKQEENMLRTLCRIHGIHFCAISRGNNMESEEIFSVRLMRLVSDLGHHNEHVNRSNAMTRLGEAMDSDATRDGGVKKMLVMDADKMLAPQDVADMFWEKVSNHGALTGAKNPLKELFGGLVVTRTIHFGRPPCSTKKPLMMKRSMAYVTKTCVGESSREREGLADSVAVIGGGRISDGFVVTAELKADLVGHIRDAYQVEVCAFGDSPLDLPMLIQADRAIVVVGDECSRSKSMEAALRDAIKTQDFVASQVVLPSTATPRLDSVKLPLLQLSQADIEAILSDSNFRLIHATNKSAATLLKTQTRDATVAGPALKEAHRRIGWYLAAEYIGKVIGLDSYKIPHVQGGLTEGHCLAGERRTTIVPLMRGGGPMAEGINDVFPLAMLVHASQPEDLKLLHIAQQDAIILVDSVINTGKTMLEFIEHVRKLRPTIRIVVVANVVQDKFISGETAANLASHGNISLIALRLSKNQFTGIGETDTGNRLFNTTHLA